MLTLLNFLVLAVAKLVEAVFLADPNYAPGPRRLSRLTRPPAKGKHLAQPHAPEHSEAAAGL